MRKKRVLSLLLALVLCLSLLPVTVLADVLVLQDGQQVSGDFAVKEEQKGWWGFTISPTPEDPSSIAILREGGPNDPYLLNETPGFWSETDGTFYVELIVGTYEWLIGDGGPGDIGNHSVTVHYYGNQAPDIVKNKPSNTAEVLTPEMVEARVRVNLSGLEAMEYEVSYSFSSDYQKIIISLAGENIPDELTGWYLTEDGYEGGVWTAENDGANHFEFYCFVDNELRFDNQAEFFLARAGISMETEEVDYFTADKFADISSEDDFFYAVDWAVNHGITTGTSETTFSPDGTVTRSQVVTFLWRAEGEPEPQTTANPFTDVKEGDWFYKSVLWAVENGITTGTSATTFSPDSICTHAEVLTFLYRANGSPDNSEEIIYPDWGGADQGDLGYTTYANALDVIKTRREIDFTINNDNWYAEPLIWALSAYIANEENISAVIGMVPCSRADTVTYLYWAY